MMSLAVLDDSVGGDGRGTHVAGEGRGLGPDGLPVGVPRRRRDGGGPGAGGGQRDRRAAAERAAGRGRRAHQAGGAARRGRQAPRRTGVSELLTGAHLEAALRDDVRYSVFRLETLQEYRGSGEDAWISAFNDGAAGPPPDPAQDEWEALVQAHRRA